MCFKSLDLGNRNLGIVFSSLFVFVFAYGLMGFLTDLVFFRMLIVKPLPNSILWILIQYLSRYVLFVLPFDRFSLVMIITFHS